MHSIRLHYCAACVLLALPAITPIPAAAAATEAARPAPVQAETERWQGRRNYLYDDVYQPGSETVGQRPSDARGCVNEPVRMRRTDGSTVVRRLQRCD